MTFFKNDFDQADADDKDDEDDKAHLYSAVVCFLTNFVRSSGEAILGTLKYFQMNLLIKIFRASGEAIFGTLKCVSERFLM